MSLLNCNRPIPQFFQAKWLNFLSGNAVDLDHVFSNVYTVSYNTKDIVELRKNIELLHSSSVPAKTVKTHGDWVIAWDCLVDTTLFVFGHRKQELQTYGKHIQRYFTSLPSQLHMQVINYDRASRIRAVQRWDIKLSNFTEFADCRSNGSTILPTLASSLIRNLDKTQIVEEVLPVVDGMRRDAPTRRPTAITYMYAPNVLTQGTVQVVAAPRAKNNPNLQWERRPRFVRSYVWSDDESPNVTTASVTKTIPPVPGPPLDELRNVAKWSVINKQSHLLCITTPVNVDSFCSLLATHPNRPLVESMCKGLRCGFWPWAVTQNSGTPSIMDNTTLQKIRNPEHLQFMEKQRDEEISLGRFSSAFTTLMPGMTMIPLWVVPKPHVDKLRLVVDHLAGKFSPNLYISPDDAGVHLDTLQVLGKSLLKVKRQYSNTPIVLFKTDVSQAYWHLPMHPLWQLHQIVMINNAHHVNNNNNFGNQGAGCLWITFFGLVLWIAVVIKHIEDLFAYVDDAFSWEFADSMSYYHPYKKLLPTKQARLLSLFNTLGVPHEERKQVSGSPLQIIGFDVDPNAMTITMLSDA